MSVIESNSSLDFDVFQFPMQNEKFIEMHWRGLPNFGFFIDNNYMNFRFPVASSIRSFNTASTCSAGTSPRRALGESCGKFDENALFLFGEDKGT